MNEAAAMLLTGPSKWGVGGIRSSEGACLLQERGADGEVGGDKVKNLTVA